MWDVSTRENLLKLKEQIEDEKIPEDVKNRLLDKIQHREDDIEMKKHRRSLMKKKNKLRFVLSHRLNKI